jgi:hypothetical protein
LVWGVVCGVVLLAFVLGDTVFGVLLLRRSEFFDLRSSMAASEGNSAQPERRRTTEIVSKKRGRKLWLLVI